MDPEQRARLETAAFEMFGRHFVSLAGSYFFLDEKGEPFGAEQGFNYSGFIISIRGTWHLVTAGHILKDLDINLKREKIAFNRCYLLDNYGANRKTDFPTPFYLEDADKAYIYQKEDGLDFALVKLDPYYQRLVEANGVLPFSEIDWRRQPREFEMFRLLGLPKELNPIAGFDPPLLVVNPVLMPLKKIDPPPDAPPTRYGRFFGKLLSSEIADIDGMSGGPVYGLAKDNDGNYRYWVVAIQSGWFPSQRIVAATPLPVVGQLLEEWLLDFEGHPAVGT